MINQMNAVLSDLKLPGRCIRAESHRHLAFFDVELSKTGRSVPTVNQFRKRVDEIGLKLRSERPPIVRLIPSEGVIRFRVAMTKADESTLKAEASVTKLWNGVRIPKPEEMLLPFILGETDEGEKLMVDFAQNPHTLIAGATGSGKSTLLHNLIQNVLMLNASGARYIDLYLVDPKRVEFNKYADHAFIDTDYHETIGTLRELVRIMEDRYAVMAAHGLQSIEQCPQAFTPTVLIVDEVAFLMDQDKGRGRGEFQRLIVTLAQKARAAGIYLVLATQRPSVNVLTGDIKANFPARIACKTATQQDSRVILDMNGAESLLTRGDAILSGEMGQVRFQVSFADPDETLRVCKWIRDNR